jgi:hypothetical protein
MTMLVEGCQELESFAYKLDYVFGLGGDQLRARFPDSPIEPRELAAALSQHKRTLQSLKLIDYHFPYLADCGLRRTDDFTFGPMTDFSELKHVTIGNHVLLGLHAEREQCIPCLWHGLPSTSPEDRYSRDKPQCSARCKDCHYRKANLYSWTDVLPASIEELDIQGLHWLDFIKPLQELAKIRKSQFPALKRIRVILPEWGTDCDMGGRKTNRSHGRSGRFSHRRSIATSC